MPPKDLIPEIPQEVENIVLKATMRDPRKRFKNALEMSIFIEKARVLMEEGKINQVRRIQLEEPQTDAELLHGGAKGKDLKKENIRKAAIISGGVFLALAVILALISIFTGGRKAIVPDVVGLTEEQAIERLEDKGFKKYTVEGVYSEDVEIGEVISQTPEGNTSASLAEVILLEVSKGQDEIEIPDVVGMSENEASRKLKAEGLQVEIKREFSKEAELGEVLSQSPEGGELLMPGETVTIIVSDGEELTNITMPNLVGKTLSSAETTLNNSKLILGNVVNEENGDYLPGQVIRQSVKAGSNVKQGTTVDLVIAKELTQKVKTIKIERENADDAVTYSILISDAKGSRIETVTMAVGVKSTTKNITYFGVGTAAVKDSGGNVITTVGLE